MESLLIMRFAGLSSTCLSRLLRWLGNLHYLGLSDFGCQGWEGGGELSRGFERKKKKKWRVCDLQKMPRLAEPSWLSAFNGWSHFDSFQGRQAGALESAYSPQRRRAALWRGACSSRGHSKSITQWAMEIETLPQSDQQKDTIYPCCTARAKVTVKRVGDRNKPHPLPIQQTASSYQPQQGRQDEGQIHWNPLWRVHNSKAINVT